MAHKRWLAPWAVSEEKPAFYHVFARIVDRRFAFEVEDKEQFRMYMRRMENFSGCRVLSYCLMCNHFHILLEVPPKSKTPLSDSELLKRLGNTRCQKNNKIFLALVLDLMHSPPGHRESVSLTPSKSSNR